jgi:hypothetical protein
MVKTSRRPRKFFTTEEADRMLPLVRSIVRDLVANYRNLASRIETLGSAVKSHKKGGPVPEGFNPEAAEREVRGLHRDCESTLRELTQLGLVCRDPARGLIEFPSVIGTISWQPGDERVTVEGT